MLSCDNFCLEIITSCKVFVRDVFKIIVGVNKELVPGYTFLNKLGSGNIGVVYHIKKISTGQEFAMKILYPKYNEDPVYVARFLEEAEYLIQFTHPNIVKGYLKGMAGGLYYFVMEYLKGENLLDKLRKEGKLSGEGGELKALLYIFQIASALEYLHLKGVVHRDIKPENIIVLKNEQVKLLDLGFAKRVEKNPDKHYEDITCGTPAYMSPEQAMGSTELDIRSDIYSLGATLYHLVFGETPFKGTTNLEIMAKQVLQELSSIKTKKGDISPLMQYFIEKMMAKDTEIRYQTPTEVKNDILENIPQLKMYLNKIEFPKKLNISDKFSSLKKEQLKDLLKKKE